MDRIADSIIRVKNAQMARHEVVRLQPNKVVRGMFEIMKTLGYVEDCRLITEGAKNFLDVILKYDKNGDPVIVEFKRVSKSSRRVYSSATSIPRIANGYATTIISTSSGLMTGKDARQKNIGGEVLAYVL